MSDEERQLPREDQPEKGGVTLPEGFHDAQPEKPKGSWICPACEQQGERTAEGRCPACGFHPRKREENALEVVLSPQSLVGSYFHRIEDDEITWAGVIVGEPQPGKYLCQIDKGEIVDRNPAQVVVPIDAMLPRTQRISIGQPGSAADAKEQESDRDAVAQYEWRFYDSAEQQMLAFAEFEAARMAERDG